MREVERYQTGLNMRTTECSEHKSEMNFVSVLSQILTNPEWLESFTNDPLGFIQQFEVSEMDRNSLLSLKPNQIKNQADMLLNKRWHEVKKLIPSTIQSMGEQCSDLFRFYASHHWPKGHCRHLIDACDFMKFIEANEVGTVDVLEKRNLRRRIRSSSNS